MYSWAHERKEFAMSKASVNDRLRQFNRWFDEEVGCAIRG